MSSPASRQYAHPRSRLPSAALHAILLVAMPGILRAQQTTTKRAAPPPQPVAVPQDSATKRTTPPRQDTPAAPRESTFAQKALTAILTALSAKDSASQPPVKTQSQALMPNVVGMDTATALKVLALSARTGKPPVSFSYAIDRPPSTLIAVDQIAEQSPAVRTPMSRGMAIRLTLAGVPRPTAFVIVPNVMRLAEQRAADTLRALGLVEDRLEQRAATAGDIGRVIGQNPAAGQRVAAGGVVAITIGQGAGVPPSKPPGSTTTPTVARTIVMPRVIGLGTRAALRILRDSGLRNLRFRIPVNTAAVDTVRAQSPDSGQRIRPTRAVVLTLAVRVPVDPIPLPPIPDPVSTPPRWWRWPAAIALALACLMAGALTARAVFPPPQIVPQIRLEPMFSDILGHKGSLVDLSVSLRSHVEHEQAVLDLAGSPLA
ncbi:MAG: PASTA domain-containing protein [Gemmatimonadetes bacterium]|nr:PASTA domain-containing protein [Gemmatimonadota bacterium]